MYRAAILLCLFVLVVSTACQTKHESINNPVSEINMVNAPDPEPRLIALNDIKFLDDKSGARIDDKDIEELSGVALAAQTNQFWGHNDKGNASELFRFDLDGKVHQTVKLKGVKNDDWEAIEHDNNGNLYIGGFGDNEEKRKVYWIHKVKEPEPDAKKIERIISYPFRYADKKSHNCEAFFIFNDNFYLITKVDNKGKSHKPEIYKLTNIKEDSINTAILLGMFNIGGLVTDAVYLDSYECLVVLTYSKILFYSIEKESDFLSEPISTIDIDFGQCEAIGFNGKDIVITNEKGEIWQYGIDQFLIKR